jgi:hypothetical protein
LPRCSRHLSHALLRHPLHVHDELLHALQYFWSNLASLDAMSNLLHFGKDTRVALGHFFAPLRVVDLLQERYQSGVEGELCGVDAWRKRWNAHLLCWRSDTSRSSHSRRHGHTRPYGDPSLCLRCCGRLLLLEVVHRLRHLLRRHVLQCSGRNAGGQSAGGEPLLRRGIRRLASGAMHEALSILRVLLQCLYRLNGLGVLGKWMLPRELTINA